MGRHRAVTTQGRYPWRATLRTVFQALVALAAGLPLLVRASGIGEASAGIGVALAVAGGVTRVMALPFTEAFLHTYAPWLAATPTPRASTWDGFGARDAGREGDL